MAWVTAGAIEPGWEYHQPDPEAEYMVHGVVPSGFDGLADADDFRAQRMGKNPGFRHGRGKDIGRGVFKCRPMSLRQREREARPSVPWLACPACKGMFDPSRNGKIRKHCPGCYVPRGRERELPDRRCGRQACPVVFRPRVRGQLYCCMPCFSLDLAQCRRDAGLPSGCCPPPPSEERLDEFRVGYLSGAPMAALRERLGVTMPTLKRWRKRLKLPARPAGNMSRQGGLSRA